MRLIDSVLQEVVIYNLDTWSFWQNASMLLAHENHHFKDCILHHCDFYNWTHLENHQNYKYVIWIVRSVPDSVIIHSGLVPRIQNSITAHTINIKIKTKVYLSIPV